MFCSLKLYEKLGGTLGGCVYFGCVDDLCRVRDSLIEHNYCHDTLGVIGSYRPGFQVKVKLYSSFRIINSHAF